MPSEINQIIDSFSHIQSLTNSGYYSRKGPSFSVNFTNLHSAQWAAIVLGTATAALKSKSPHKPYYTVSQGHWKEKAAHQLFICSADKNASYSSIDPNFLKDLKEAAQAVFKELSQGWQEERSSDAARQYKAEWVKHMDEPEKLVVFSRVRSEHLKDEDLILTYLASKQGLFQKQPIDRQKIHVEIYRETKIFMIGKREHLNQLINAIRAEALE